MSQCQLRYLNVPPVDRLPLLSQDLLDVSLALEVRPPVQVVSYQVQVVAAFAPHYDDPLGVRLLADDLLVLCVANFASVAKEHFWLFHLPQCLFVSVRGIVLSVIIFRGGKRTN